MFIEMFGRLMEVDGDLQIAEKIGEIWHLTASF
jgi:hypothetical protein